MLELTPHIWKKIKSRQYQKGLISRYDGPFEILKRIGPVAYKLKLPERLQLHPSFHVSFLKPYHEDPNPDRVQAKRPPPNICKEFSRDIASILQDRKMGNWKVKWTEFLFTGRGHPRVKQAGRRVPHCGSLKIKYRSICRPSRRRRRKSQVGGGGVVCQPLKLGLVALGL